MEERPFEAIGEEPVLEVHVHGYDAAVGVVWVVEGGGSFCGEEGGCGGDFLGGVGFRGGGVAVGAVCEGGVRAGDLWRRGVFAGI